MDQTTEMRSPNSLLDAEGDNESAFGEIPQHQDDAAATQAADALCKMGAIDASQADGHASQTFEPCLPEHPATLSASQARAEVDRAMDSALEPAVPEPSCVDPDQAMASTLEPEVTEPSHAEAAITSTAEQESEPRIEDSTQPSEPPHRVLSPEVTIDVQETDTQTMTREIRLSVESPAIDERHGENSEAIADDKDDGHHAQSPGSASTGSSRCRAASEDTETPSVVSRTTSRNREAGSGRRTPVRRGRTRGRHPSVAHGTSDLPMSIPDDEERSGPIIVDDNGGRAIVIDDSDEEMDIDDDHSSQNPLPRAQRNRVTQRSPEMVNWTSKEYEKRSAAGLIAAWKKVWKQWRLIKSKADRQLAQTLDRFDKEMSDVWRYELWNEKYREGDGRRVYNFWVERGMEMKVMTQLRGEGARRLVRKFGRALRQLQEEEEEHQSIAVTMGDGDREDCDYQPTRTRRHW